MNMDENSDDDNSSDPSYDSDSDWLHEIQCQIESNDPDLTKLTIGGGNYRPYDGNWERDGEGIGRNTQINKLVLGNGLHDNVSRDQFEAFCEGMAGNKSIERLQIDCCTLYGGEIFNILSVFFQQNSNLRCLKISYTWGSDTSLPDSVRLLSEVLTRFKTLSKFECYGAQLGDGDVGTIVQALAGHSSLTKVDLGGTTVGERGLAALAVLLINPKSSLENLVLGRCHLNDEEALILAPALGRNSMLKKLNIACNGDITITGWRAVFAQLQSRRSSLDNLLLWGNSIDDATANLLANALANGSHLKALNLGRSSHITTEGWRAFLRELLLHNNEFNDEDVTYLSSYLANNRILRHLDLSSNSEVTALGWREFSAVLQNPNTALEKIDLQCNSIDDDALVFFANSLVHNNKLKELLLFGGWAEEDITMSAITGWEVLSNVLCNKSSINATFNSNHTLQRILNPDRPNMIGESDLPSDLRNLIQLNRETTRAKAARRKVIDVHFSGAFNMQHFIDMELKALPDAIAWMARDEYGSSLTYKFVRNTTLFVGIGGT